jgi:DNA-directed RNA polymerase subunit M/transcription elongation factor TFIIS
MSSRSDSSRDSQPLSKYEKQMISEMKSLNINPEITSKIKKLIQVYKSNGIDIETNYKYQTYVYELITTAMDSEDYFNEIYDNVSKSLAEYESPFQMVVKETNDIANKNLVYSTKFYSSLQKEEDEFNRSIRFGTNIEDGVYECPNCHSKKTVSQSKQTSASDEEIKAKIFCYSCKKVWNMGQIKIKKDKPVAETESKRS